MSAEDALKSLGIGVLVGGGMSLTIGGGQHI